MMASGDKEEDLLLNDEELEGDHEWHFRYNRRLSCFSHSVSSLAFSQDGQYLVSGTGSGDVKVWDTLRWSESGRLKGCRKEEPRALVISPAQRWLVAAYPKVLHIFNCCPPWKLQHSLAAGVEESTKEHSEWTCIAFSPMAEVDHPGGHTGQDNHLATFSSATLCVLDYSGGWTADTPRRTRSLMQSSVPTSAAYTSCGSWLIVGFQDGQVQVWNAFSLTMEKTLSAHTDTVTCIAATPRKVMFEARFVSTSADQTLRLWHSSGWILEQHVHETKCDKLGVREAAFSSTGGWLVSTAKGLSVWRVSITKRGRIILTLHQRLSAICGAEGLRTAAFCGGGDAIAVGSRDGVLGLWTKAPGFPVESRDRDRDDGLRPKSKGRSEAYAEPWTANRQLAKPMQKVSETGVKPLKEATTTNRGEWFRRSHMRSLSMASPQAQQIRLASTGPMGRLAVLSPDGAFNPMIVDPLRQSGAAVHAADGLGGAGGMRGMQRNMSTPDMERWKTRRSACNDALPSLTPTHDAGGRRVMDPHKRLGMVPDDEEMLDERMSPVKKNMLHACRNLVQRIQVDPKVITDERESAG
mmetsp:Transcript_25430/g.64658  ORF Transcript_25430/g.64658 Transcript_25430/m.64658 type:complete len:580 (+) Transcript_25430:184-1923(+)|eukprot:CAMPEP_0195115814 /NCGR_PEP_ID=MMETSP0448-20130528/110136_1 /TAXON_ID=66468 /ORGANISM="Heterocapsa triquestra, Strain CCMP 448" /LENGTH=579 /DNA_ID=CAMNT_0040152943 /DNA_START=125 /DNA_END=1864 /DNA_ORIENTATION=+